MQISNHYVLHRTLNLKSCGVITEYYIAVKANGLKPHVATGNDLKHGILRFFLKQFYTNSFKITVILIFPTLYGQINL